MASNNNYNNSLALNLDSEFKSALPSSVLHIPILRFAQHAILQFAGECLLSVTFHFICCTF